MNDKEVKLPKFYEGKYSGEADPWGYQTKAVEILRSEFVVNLVLSKNIILKNILDVGCSSGHLSFKFLGKAENVYGIDVSQTIIEKAKHSSLNYGNGNATSQHSTNFQFQVGSLSDKMFDDNFFDLVLLCDGIDEWFLNEEQKLDAVRETMRILKPNTVAVFSDYMNPKRFNDYTKLINSINFSSVEIYYLHDRLAYQFNSWFKAFDKYTFVKKIYANKKTCSILMKISSLFGKTGSKHIIVLAKK